MSKKTEQELLKEELFYTPESAYFVCDDKEIAKAEKFCEGYIGFLNACRTEREINASVKELAS